MFQMNVEKIFKVGGVVSVSGTCENKRNFSNKLVDEAGCIYEAYVPLGKDLVLDDASITLEIKGISDANNLIGKILKVA